MTFWIVIAVAVLSVALLLARQAALRLRRAQTEYQDALVRLEAAPNDNSLRIQALEKGRAFADLARERAGSKGRAIFDEVALSNDLNARVSVGSAAGVGPASDEWPCPDCAETVKKAARKCRFCGCVFDEASVGAYR